MYSTASFAVHITWRPVRSAASLLTASRISSASGGVIGSGGMGSQTCGSVTGKRGETGVSGWFFFIHAVMVGRSSMVEVCCLAIVGGDRDNIRSLSQAVCNQRTICTVDVKTGRHTAAALQADLSMLGSMMTEGVDTPQDKGDRHHSRRPGRSIELSVKAEARQRKS